MEFVRHENGEDMRMRNIWRCGWICRIEVFLSVLVRIHVFRNVTLCWLSGSWCFKALWPIAQHHILEHLNAYKSNFLHILGLILLPVVVALSSAWSVPFLACMSRWIMSGRTMPLSSRNDMVLCTSDRKKFTTELDMNLMWSNCVHGTENKYCKRHNTLNANSCLCHTY